MGRIQGTLAMGNNIEVNVSAPLDARTVVAKHADLTLAETFPYSYVGLVVAVQDEGKLYQLIALPTTEPSNWSEVGKGFDPSNIEGEIAKKAEGYIETTTDTAVPGDNKELEEGQIVTIKSLDGTQEYRGVVDANGVATIDVDGKTVTVENDATNGLLISNPSGADIDDTSMDITTERVHKIDSRLLPKGDKSETADYLEGPLTVKEAQGKYGVGDIIPANTSLEEIVIKMLTKTNYPTLTAPRATLTGTGAKIIESGSTLNIILTATFDRGSISPAYGTSGYRAGEATAYSINGGGEQVENTFSETVTEVNNTFTATVKYAAGEQPKDDEGGNFQEPLEAGSLTTNSVSYEFVDAIYSNSANNSVIAKETLVSRSTGQKIFVFAPQTATSPETFDIPASWTVLAIEVLNDLSGKWEDNAREFDVSDITHPNAAGVDVAYKRYTDNRGYSAGSRSIRVRWS